MENKQTAPKEIWINLDGMTSYSLSKTEGKTKYNPVNGEWLNYDSKYLSETHVKELLSDKDKKINDLLKIVSERNAELAEKEREIDALEKWKKMILQYDGEIINNLTKQIEQLKKQLEK